MYKIYIIYSKIWQHEYIQCKGITTTNYKKQSQLENLYWENLLITQERQIKTSLKLKWKYYV